MKSAQAKLLIFVIIGIIVLGIFGLNVSGFCLPERRWISDEEKIDRAITKRIIMRQSAKIYVVSQKMLIDNPSTYYESLDDFKQKNPNCCSFNLEQARDVGVPTLWDRITGGYSNVLIVSFGPDHRDFENRHIKQTRIYLDNCGRDIYN